ncbi:MAG: hypothetical protein HZB62_15690 [Nitrospirae bacterium]|nr:hypothetical protein [Nitrospirota bacterium]
MKKGGFRVVEQKGLCPALPHHVDPCGGNRAFCSFIFAGRCSSNQSDTKKGEVVVRNNRFHFRELLSV